MEWIDCNIGSKLTMKYPSCYLMGDGARGEVLSIAFAGKNQHQDAGAKMFHFAPNTKSRIVSDLHKHNSSLDHAEKMNTNSLLVDLHKHESKKND